MSATKALESENQIFGGLLGRVFGNVVRGFSLVLHDPEGSHCKIRR
jgi:hypothetical protein